MICRLTNVQCGKILIVSLFVLSLLFHHITPISPEESPSAELRVDIEATEYSPTSATLVFSFTLESHEEFNYKYEEASLGVKPRILVQYDDNRVFVGVYDWKRIETGRTDIYDAQATKSYSLQTFPLDAYLFPWGKSAYTIYMFVNGVSSIPSVSSRTHVGYMEISSEVKEMKDNEVPERLRQYTQTDDGGRYLYGPCYVIITHLSYSLAYVVMHTIVFIVILLFALGPIILYLARKYTRDYRCKWRKEWRYVVLSLVIILFTYRSAFSPKWITLLDIVLSFGLFSWTVVAYYDLSHPYQNGVSGR